MDNEKVLKKRQQIAVCQWCLPDSGPQGLKLAAELGYDGVEMDMGLNRTEYSLLEPHILEQFLAARESAGIQTPSLALNYLGLNNPAARKETEKTIDRAIEIAVKLSAATLQLCSFWHEGMRDEAEFSETVEILRYACGRAKSYGIAIGSENQLDVEGNLRLVKEVGEENFGIYFDTANPYLFDDREGLAMLPLLYPHICELHIKDYRKAEKWECVPLGEGQCYALEAAGLLKARGYKNWTVVENNLSAGELERDVRTLRELFA